MLTDRRSVLRAIGLLAAAPLIVRAASLMPVRVREPKTPVVRAGATVRIYDVFKRLIMESEAVDGWATFDPEESVVIAEIGVRFSALPYEIQSYHDMRLRPGDKLTVDLHQMSEWPR